MKTNERFKKTVTLFCVFLLSGFVHTLFAQPKKWMSLLDNTPAGAGFLSDIKQTADSGFIVLDNITGPALTKLDKYGMLEWNKVVGPSAFGGQEVQPTSDGGYIVCGGIGDVVKTDATGNVQWTNSYGQLAGGSPGVPGQFCVFYSIQQTTDLGYIVTGTTSNFGTKGGPHTSTGIEGTDIYLVKLFSNGTLEWAKTYGNGHWLEEGHYVRQTGDGGFIIAGQNEQPNVGQWVENSGFLIKTASDGTLQWSKYYGTQSPYYISPITGMGQISGSFGSVEETPDGGYIAAGDVGNSYGAAVVKMDNTGNVQWAREFFINGGCGGFGRRAYPTLDGGYMVYGVSGSCPGKQSFLLFKADFSGNTVWSRSYGSGNDANLGISSFAATSDKGYALIGHTYETTVGSHTNSGGFNYVIKTDSLGRNGDCQNTKTGAFAVPDIYTADFLVTVNTASLVIARTYTASVYTLISDTAICLNLPLQADFYTNITCDKDSTSFSNNSTGGLFEWDFGDPASGSNNFSTKENPRHKYPSTGTYTVTLIAKDETGSPSDTAVKTVDVVSSDFLADTPDIIFCNGHPDSTLLIATGTWTWFSGWTPTDSLRDPFNDTTYAYPDVTTQYSAYAYNGACYDYDTVLVTVVPVPTLDLTSPTTICEGIGQVLSVIGADTYIWSPSETLDNATAGIVIATPTITTTYTVTDANGCGEGSVFTTISVISRPPLTVSPDVTLCEGENAVLAGNGCDTYVWYPATGLNAVTGSSVVLTASAGDITYTVTGSDIITGCSNVAQINIITNSLPAVIVSSDQLVCQGNSAVLAAGGGVEYQWSPADHLNTVTGNNVTASPVEFGVYGYSVTVTDDNGCVSVGTVTITVVAELTANAGSDKTICTGKTVKLFGSGGQNYSWSPPTGLSDPDSYTTDFGISPVGTYDYTLTTSSGMCSATDSVRITVADLPLIQAHSDTAICAGNSATLSAAGGVSYVWDPGGQTTGVISFTPAVTLAYTVTGTDANGCVNTASAQVTVNNIPLPQINIGSSITIVNGSSTQLAIEPSGSISGYSWQPNEFLSCDTCANTEASPTITTTYYLIITDTNGCSSSASVEVVVVPFCTLEPFVPNVFSPNADGNNDLLYVYGGSADCYSDYSFKIYNRWGENVFETTDINKGWDGTFRAKEIPSDVFVYFLKGILFTGETVDARGNISLVK